MEDTSKGYQVDMSYELSQFLVVLGHGFVHTRFLIVF